MASSFERKKTKLRRGAVVQTATRIYEQRMALRQASRQSLRVSELRVSELQRIEVRVPDQDYVAATVTIMVFRILVSFSSTKSAGASRMNWSPMLYCSCWQAAAV
ncbi:MAG: hypothetical protein ACI9HK_004783 [Pirellulaceae bacterium]|jgi:hypothetical protein